METIIKSSKNLTPKQQHAIFLLSQGVKINEVAKQLNVTRVTIRNWLKLEPVINELDRVLNEFAVSSMLNLSGASEDAARVIRGLVNDETIKPETRLKAAIATFDVLKNAELVRIQAEIEQLRQLLKNKSDG